MLTDLLSAGHSQQAPGCELSPGRAALLGWPETSSRSGLGTPSPGLSLTPASATSQHGHMCTYTHTEWKWGSHSQLSHRQIKETGNTLYKNISPASWHSTAILSLKLRFVLWSFSSSLKACHVLFALNYLWFPSTRGPAGVCPLLTLAHPFPW